MEEQIRTELIRYFNMVLALDPSSRRHNSDSLLIRSLLLTQTGRTALYLAAKDNHADVVSFLLKAGASMDKANSVSRPFLCKSIVVWLKLCVSFEQNRWTPLMQASQRGHTSIVRLLVAAGADGTLRNNVRLPDNLNHTIVGMLTYLILMSHVQENHTALDKAANTEIRDILKSPYGKQYYALPPDTRSIN
jgi:ankyrin repeat protein